MANLVGDIWFSNYISAMVFEHTDYRIFLRETLAAKAARSKGYSLRAFSGKMNISNSYLSEVLNRKKTLSMELAFKMAVHLDLTEAETQYFCLLVQKESEKDPAFQDVIQQKIHSLNPGRRAQQLSADSFSLISEWYHFPILELTSLTDFNAQPESISKKLGITPQEATAALERLERLQLLEKQKNGRYRKTNAELSTMSDVPNSAFRRYHRQILEKASECFDTQAPKERINATEMVAIDSKYLAKIDRLSREFSSAVFDLATKSKVKDSVYALSMHFFKISKSQAEQLHD